MSIEPEDHQKKALYRINQAKQTQALALVLAKLSLRHLPDPLFELTWLQELNLSWNSLKQLPESLLALTNLKKIYLYGNPLNLPPEWLGKNEWDGIDAQALFIYLRDNVFSKDKEPLNETKLLLVGEGAVGKTQLANLLVGRKFGADSLRTDGIAIERVHLPAINQIRINLWDFGGQEIMHATHQFFLSERSLYLLVWDVRDEDRYNLLDHWLYLIRSFGKDSPVIVVLNKKDIGKQQVDRRGLQQRFPQIKSFIETSCKTGEGLEQLRAEICTQIQGMPHVTTPFSSKWRAVMQGLVHSKLPYVNFAGYQTLCERVGVAVESRETLIRFLHDLGAVLCFRGDRYLEHTGVLKPEWATNGVYCVLTATGAAGTTTFDTSSPKASASFLLHLLREVG